MTSAEDPPVPSSHPVPKPSGTDLRALWTVLETHRPSAGDLRTAGTGVVVTAGEVLTGVDDAGNWHLLVPLRTGEAARTDTRSAGTHLGRVQTDNGHYLTVLCLAQELRGVFTQFARELLGAVRNSDSPARSTAETYERWRKLFTAAHPDPGLGEEQLVGLKGELVSVAALLRHDAPGALTWWTGPAGSPHDLRAPRHAVEVKSTLLREGRIVVVHGVDQLRAPPGAGLWLTHHQFDADPAGSTLAELAEAALEAGADRRALEERLDRAGATARDLAADDQHRHRLTGTRTYAVDQPHFPRITRDSFTGGDLPPGVLRLTYSVDLTNEPPHPLTPTETTTLLFAFAHDATPPRPDAGGSRS